MSTAAYVKQAVGYALLLVAVRTVLIVAIGWFTGGVEFAGDVEIQRHYIADPLQLLLGRATTYDVFPPLFPLLLWCLHAPLSPYFSPFVTYRAAMVLAEVLAWPLIWRLITKSVDGRGRHVLALAYIVAPMCWVTTVFMCQDEAISMVFFAAVILALLHRRVRLAILLCGLGVVTAKIYFLVPLVGLLGVPLQRTWRNWLVDAALGWAPIVAVYGVQAALIGRAGVAAEAFDRFVIPFEMSVSIWALLDGAVSDEAARRISAVCAFALSMIPLLIVWHQRRLPGPHAQVALVTAMLTWVYAGFFHINPEYYLILTPGLFVVLRPAVAVSLLIIGFSLPWAVNFFYGVQIGIERADAGRAPFVRIYHAVTSADPLIAHSISVVAVCLLSVTLAILLTRRAVARDPNSATI
jgi:hypothetical protein